MRNSTNKYATALCATAFTALLLFAAGCLRNDSICESAEDCFASESCRFDICTPVLTGEPAPESFIDEAALGVSLAFVLDGRDEPNVFVLNNDDTLVRWTWDGFSWTRTRIAADLELDNLSSVEATYASGVGFVVVVGQASRPAVFHSVDGESWSLERAFDDRVFNPTIVSHRNDVVLCAFTGDLSGDFDLMQPHLAIRARDGTWSMTELPDPATPFCAMAFSQHGLLTLALADWDEDSGHRTRIARTLVNPISALDLALSGALPGVPVSGESLDVQGGAAVLLHASDNVVERILWVTRILDWERSTSRALETIPMTRFYANASVRADPLDDRRALVALETASTFGSEPSRLLGPLISDRFDARPIEKRAEDASFVVHRIGSDGVARMVFATPEGLVFRIGL